MESLKKQLVSVGGTSRSGSTLLARILSNNPSSKNLGEISALFHPWRVHHFEFIRELKATNSLWRTILLKPKNGYPEAVFSEFRDSCFIDSSKNVHWIHKAASKASKLNINQKNVLIFKNPTDFAYSILKRGNQDWVQQYVSYHRKYFALIPASYFVYYRDFIMDKSVLQQLYGWLKLNYNERVIDYKSSDDIGFFGSQTPKKHLKLKYDSFIPPEFLNKIMSDIDNNPEVEEIWNYLYHNRNKYTTIDRSLGYSRMKMIYYCFRYMARIKFRSRFPEKYIPHT